MSTVSNNVNAIRKFFGDYEGHDLSEYETVVDENIVGHGPRPKQTALGSMSTKEIDASYLVGFPDLKLTVLDIFGADDKVTVRWNWKATHLGDYLGIKATHKKIDLDGVHIFKFNETGKIIESWANYNILGVLEQIGVFSLESVQNKGK